MSQAFGIPSNSASLPGAKTGTQKTRDGYASEVIAKTARAISPRKTWAYLCDRIGVSERVAKHRMAQAREFSTDELAALLRSEEGFAFLTALMDEAQPTWWRGVKRAFALGDLRRQQQKIREAIDEVETTDRALERAEAALRFCAEERDRKVADPVRPQGGFRGRAMA